MGQNKNTQKSFNRRLRRVNPFVQTRSRQIYADGDIRVLSRRRRLICPFLCIFVFLVANNCFFNSHEKHENTRKKSTKCAGYFNFTCSRLKISHVVSIPYFSLFSVFRGPTLVLFCVFLRFLWLSVLLFSIATKNIQSPEKKQLKGRKYGGRNMNR